MVSAMNLIEQSHADLVARIASALPIIESPRLSADELASLSLTVSLAFSAFKEHMLKVAEAVAERCTHVDRADLVGSIDAHLSDACGDLAGALARASEDERDELYDGCPRGPFFRSRRS